MGRGQTDDVITLGVVGTDAAANAPQGWEVLTWPVVTSLPAGVEKEIAGGIGPAAKAAANCRNKERNNNNNNQCKVCAARPKPGTPEGPPPPPPPQRRGGTHSLKFMAARG